MINSKVGIVVLLGLLVAACTTSPIRRPVIEDSQSAPIERESETDVGPASGRLPDSNAATETLLASARTATEANNHGNAIAYLERAVRIDPRNAGLWIQLSAAHLADKNLAAAEQHTRKAIALAGQNAGLIRSAWLQLATIREAQGNNDEAKAIRRRYRSIPG